MKHSELLAVAAAVLGPRSAVMNDLVIPSLGSRTPTEALEAGLPPQEIWDAVCREMGLGEDARFAHRAERPT